jgi:uncharacterized coiled-coil DUF342 family protein
MEEIDWKLASNTQLKEELERLENGFSAAQEEMRGLVDKIDELNAKMSEMSKSYIEIKEILNKREGKQ